MQSVEDDIIDDESGIDDELLWAKPGTTADATEPAASKAMTTAICFFIMEVSGENTAHYKIRPAPLVLYFIFVAGIYYLRNELPPATFADLVSDANQK